MNKLFIKGFCLGVILKDALFETLKTIVFNGIESVHKMNTKLKSKIENKITNIHFICKIENDLLFAETFDEKFQPGWKYFSEKGSLKITLDEDTIEHFYNSKSVSRFYEMIDSSGEHVFTLDLPLFEKLGKNYLFVEYYFDNHRYINIYEKDSEILKEDFIIQREGLLFDNILCSSVKIKNVNHYITNYLKLFSNNKRTPITAEMVFLFNDEYNTDLKQLNLITICNKAIFNHSYNDELK
jgi:hypothetical protein